MLKYKNIYAYRECQHRLSRSSYYSVTNHTRESDSLASFTLEPHAFEDAQNNLDHCFRVARDHDAEYLVLHENRVQFLGKRIREGALQALAPPHWIRDYREWAGSSYGPDIYDDRSAQGELYGISMWRRCLALKATQGIYDVSSGRRIKNRREIITRFWDRGFAAQRGIPLSVAKIRWAGSREELENITELADRYWTRKNTSDVAKKVVASFRSINRYCAWPGAW